MAHTLTTPEEIDMFRIITLRSALKLELKGIQMTRGRTAYSMVKEEFNLKGSKQKVYDQFNALIEYAKGN